jgi:hypothetical protein
LVCATCFLAWTRRFILLTRTVYRFKTRGCLERSTARLPKPLVSPTMPLPRLPGQSLHDTNTRSWTKGVFFTQPELCKLLHSRVLECSMKLTWSLRRSAEELYERGLPEPGPVAALQDQRGENDGWEGLVPGCGARAVQQLLRALQVGRCAASLRRWIRARRNDMSHPIPCPFLLTWASAPRFACHATHLLVPVLMGLKRGIPALYPLRTYHTTGPRPPLATCPHPMLSQTLKPFFPAGPLEI